MQYRKPISLIFLLSALGVTGLLADGPDDSSNAANSLGISFTGGSSSSVILERDGKRYEVDVAAKTIQARASNGDRPAKSEVKNGAPAARLRQPPTRTAFFTC